MNKYRMWCVESPRYKAVVRYFTNVNGAVLGVFCFFFSSRRRHTRFDCDWSSDVCSSDLLCQQFGIPIVLLVADFAGAVDQTALGRAVISLKQAAQWAAGFDVRLALEFRSSDRKSVV